MSTASNHKKILFMTQFSILLAIEALFCFTPLGSLPALGPIVATVAIVPVVITAILLGPGAGTAMGAFAGLFSFIVWSFMPPPQSAFMAFVFTPFYSVGEYSGNFWSLVICFVPRILSGTVAAYVFKGMRRMRAQRENLAFLLAGALGSLVNTFGVTLGIFFFFGRSYAAAIGIGYDLLLGIIVTTIVTSGIPEAVINALAALFVCRPIHRYLLKHAE